MPLGLLARALGLRGAQRLERALAVRNLRKLESGSADATAPPFHHSHRHELLQALDRETWCGTEADRPSAVIVPTARPAGAPRSGIAFAARVALRHSCPLVLLVSHEAATAASIAALERQITVPTGNGSVQPNTLLLAPSRKPTKLTSFAVDDLPISRAYRRGGDAFGEGRLKVNDVGRKRNLALLLAAGMRWQNALLLDDDIFATVDGEGREHLKHPSTLDAASLQAAVRAVREGHLAVGWVARGFDDNSVLCRIAGQMGAPQDQFVGGGALLVPVDARTPFFPSIYNEDWLFLLRLRCHRIPGRAELLDGGDVHQDEYPAYLASRAAAEELGDLLGEGMLALLHRDGNDEVDSPSFWRKAMEERRRLRVELRSQVAESDHDLRNDMLKALGAVEMVHERLSGEEDYWVSQFITYSKVWLNDLRNWGRRLHPDDLPKPGRLLACKEFESARTFGGPTDPDDFIRRFTVGAAAPDRKVLPIRG